MMRKKARNGKATTQFSKRCDALPAGPGEPPLVLTSLPRVRT